MIEIVVETPDHVSARERLLQNVFAGAHRTRTCARLRHGRIPADGLSLVAMERGEVVGTIRFWHVRAGMKHNALMLGPVAVAAGSRKRGVGAALLRAGLDRARAFDHKAVILVGDAPYYGRFGFSQALTDDLRLPGLYERERFLGLELAPGGLAGATGLVIPTGAKLPETGATRSAADCTRRSIRRRAA